MSIQSAENIQPDSNLSILLKGSFGEGKTIAAASFAIFGPVWIAYWDKKKPVELLTFFKKHRPELLPYINFEVFGAHNANEFLNRLFEFQDNGCKYTTVVNDSVTFMTSGAVNWSMGFRGAPQKDKGAKVEGHKLIPDFDEYKVETSIASQALDIMKTLPAFNIWTAHPLPKLEVKGSGNTMTITKSSVIVSYGQKVGAMVPGAFNEIYHFARKVDYNTNPTTNRRIICTDMIGDDFSKTSLDLPKEFDITDKLFAEVWQKLINKEVLDAVTHAEKKIVEPTKTNTGSPWVNPYK